MEKLYFNLRVVWAITTKDVVDALKNKAVLGLFLSTLFWVVFYRALPMLGNLGKAPQVLVYAAGRSSLLTALENSDAVRLQIYPSRAAMERRLADGDVPELGLAIPADWDESDGEAELQGYVQHWVSASDAAELKRYVETHLTEQSGRPVRIQIDGNVIYLQPDSNGIGVGVSFGLVFVILMVGVSLVPNLMLDEKLSKTLEALLVSPAGPGHITIAKALTGLFYCMLSVGVALAINYTLVTQWWLAILATLCGSLFAVAIGLLLGTLFETRQQFTLWAWVLVIPLVIPVILSMLIGQLPTLLPAWVISFLRWIPTVALFDVLRVSFSNQASFGLWLPWLALILTCAGLILGSVAWLARRLDQ